MNQSPTAVFSHRIVEEPFVTERLQLAVFLHASNLLTLDRCELSPSGKVRFIFIEPRPIGEQGELSFDLGASVPATALFASQKFLRRKINELMNRRINDSNNTEVQR